MWNLVAAEASAPSGVSDQLILMVGGTITAAIVALGGVLVAIVNSRSNKTTPSPPAPAAATSADEHVLYERTAVLYERTKSLNDRADDNDDRDDVQDRRHDIHERRLEQIERALDLKDSEWRRP